MYLPVYNVGPCIICTLILDCTLRKKKKRRRRRRSRKQRKWLGTSIKNGVIISSQLSLDAWSAIHGQLVLPMDSLGGQSQ